MKNIFKIHYLLIMVFVFFSCSKDQSTEPEVTSNLMITQQEDFRASFDYYTGNQKLVDEINTKGAPTFPLSQAEVDYYMGIAGYPYSIDAERANTLMNEVLMAQDLGLEKYMDEVLRVTKFTKETVLKITQVGPVEDIESAPEFRNLPTIEQDMILGVNDLAKSYFANMPRQVTADNILGAVSYGASGFMAGMAFCNWPCGIAGGIIGGIFGWFNGPGPK